MPGIKRKDSPSDAIKAEKRQKSVGAKAFKPSKQGVHDDSRVISGNGVENRASETPAKNKSKYQRDGARPSDKGSGAKQFTLDTSSAEAHAKQRALAKERKANKPNADAIQRSKKIWERLRRKSHVPPEERKQLVAELFTLLDGNVRDFVFKHDSVRVVQCALKYANQDQRKQIIKELKGDIRTLAESRYGKFLVAKIVQDGDAEVRNAVVPEFYGHVKRLINHPEASWIVDDIYRQIATQQQKATMLREWYGAEFALFHRKPDAKVAAVVTYEDTADLNEILQKSPEKRRPILQYLLQLINQLIQKKMTGFTMLHDAMLQYFLALTPFSTEQNEFLEILKGDIDAETEGGGGDVFRNLAFTKSGSRLVCFALAYGNAKDRKVILKVFKDTVEVMAHDQYAKMVLVVGLDVPDDTKMTAKSICFELLGQNIEDEKQRLDRLEAVVTNLHARVPVLYPLAGPAKWLLNEQDKAILAEVHKIRETTSKKDPEARRRGLLEYVSAPLLELSTKRAEELATSSFGCQFMTESLLETVNEPKSEAKSAIARLAEGDPAIEGHLAQNIAVGRMLKTIVMGGKFNPKTQTVVLVEPKLGFGEVLYPLIKDHLLDWACGVSSFVVVGLLESEDVPTGIKDNIRASLKEGKEKLEVAAAATGGAGEKSDSVKGNAGARILLEKVG